MLSRPTQRFPVKGRALCWYEAKGIWWQPDNNQCSNLHLNWCVQFQNSNTMPPSQGWKPASHSALNRGQRHKWILLSLVLPEQQKWAAAINSWCHTQVSDCLSHRHLLLFRSSFIFAKQTNSALTWLNLHCDPLDNRLIRTKIRSDIIKEEEPR